MNRESIFADEGWYPREIDEIKKYFVPIPKEKKIDVIGCVCPHAGWMFSGKVAGEVYSLINPADVYVLLGPNHTGLGKNSAVYPEGYWETPLGKIKVATDLVNLIIKYSEFLEKDSSAHLREHSLEVQLPFLQYLAQEIKKEFSFVPITLKIEDYHTCKDIGNSIALGIKEYKKSFPSKKIVIIASTDMTHYESQSYAKKMDSLAIEEILNLSDKGLYDTVLSYGISMCGVYPTVSMIVASKLLGAKEAKLIKYQTSGDVSKEYDRVVGYAGIVMF